MKLLALDTSTDACSAAACAGEAVHERFELAPRRHAQLLLSMVSGVLADAGWTLSELDAVAFGRGPGSFTGVRIATSVAQALALGAGLPAVAVSSLAALAQSAFQRHGVRRCAAAFDARMDEVYYGVYRIDADGIAREEQEESVCSPERVPPLQAGACAGVGPGWAAHGSRLGRRLGTGIDRVYPDEYPRAGGVAVLGAAGWREGEAVSAETARPVYLRDRVTRT